MISIIGKIYADEDQITEYQRTDVRDGMAACSAFWLAAMEHRSYATEHLRPHGRCIYSALAVEDILKKTGRHQARVQKVGLDVRRFSSDRETVVKGFAVGSPKYQPQSRERRWNAHLIVRLGDVFIDPSIAQACRPWNDIPNYAAMIGNVPVGQMIDIGDGIAPVNAGWFHPWETGYVQVTYFDLLRAQDVATRGFRKAPDAKQEARQDVVEMAISRLLKG